MRHSSHRPFNQAYNTAEQDTHSKQLQHFKAVLNRIVYISNQDTFSCVKDNQNVLFFADSSSKLFRQQLVLLNTFSRVFGFD